jgi:hypothetical protein
MPNNKIKTVGWLQAIDSGITSSVSMIGRVFIGILAGLPLSAIAISNSVSFILSSALEFPTGIISDIIGYRKSVILGYICQAFASLSLFMSIYFFQQNNSDLMWTFLVTEAVLDAFGSAINSGGAEVFYQSIIESDLEDSDSLEQQDYIEKSLMVSEKYGRYFSFLFPIFAIAFALYLHAQFEFGHFLFLVNAVSWCLLATTIVIVSNNMGTIDTPVNAVKEQLASWKNGFKTIFTSSIESKIIRNNSLVRILAIISYGAMEGYFIVMLLRQSNSYNWTYEWVPYAVICFIVLLSNLSRSFLIPAIIERISASALTRISSWGSLLVSVLFLANMDILDAKAKLAIYLVYLFVFQLLLSGVMRSNQGVLLRVLPNNIRATMLSLCSCVSLLILGIYSIYLGQFQGVPTIEALLKLNIFISLTVVVLNIYYNKLVMRNNENTV